MKTSKSILRLINQRMTYAVKLNSVDCKIKKWLTKKGFQDSDLESDYGCMITTEPYQYAQKTIELIESEGE